MKFGSDEFFNKLYNKVSSGKQENSDIYDELCYVIENDVRPKIYQKLKDNYDTEEVLQDVYLSVYKGLVKFLLTSRDKLPEQRQAWLNRIVDRKVIDFQDKLNEKIYVIDENNERIRKFIPHVAVYLDDDSKPEDGTVADISAENVFFGKYANDILVMRLHHLFSINTSLDRLVGYCYSKIIIPLWEKDSFTEKASGKPKDTSNMLDGINMALLIERMEGDLSDAVQRTLPDELFDILRIRLNEKKRGTDKYWKDICFYLTPEEIRDATNRIQEKVDKETKRLEKEAEEKNRVLEILDEDYRKLIK